MRAPMALFGKNIDFDFKEGIIKKIPMSVATMSR